MIVHTPGIVFVSNLAIDGKEMRLAFVAPGVHSQRMPTQKQRVSLVATLGLMPEKAWCLVWT